jgi:PAS domain S-box-containing protein
MTPNNGLALAFVGGGILAGLGAAPAWRRVGVALGLAAALVGVVSLAMAATAPEPPAPPAPPEPPQAPEGAPPPSPPPQPAAPPEPPAPALAGIGMSELTSSCFILLGLGVAAGRSRRREPRALADAATVLVALVAIYDVGAFTYGAPDLARAARMPLPTGLTLLLAAAAHVVARPQAPAGALLLSAAPDGRLARRLLPAIVAGPLLLGDLRLRAQDAGLVTTEQGTALYAFAVVVLLGSLVAAVLAGLRAEHRAAARAQERFLRVFEASPVGIALSRPDGRLVDANDAMARIAGRPRDELRAPGATAAALWPEPGQHERLVAAARTGNRVQGVRAELPQPGGRPRVVELAAELIDVGGETLLLSLADDVTARERAREEHERRVAAEADLDRTRRLDELRAEFINHTAHELGTPLTPVVMQMHVLEASLEQATPAQRKAFDGVKRGVGRLEGVVRDVVEAARVQAGRMLLDRQRVDVGAEVEAAVAAYRGAAERQGVRIEAEVLGDGGEAGALAVDADAARLRLALGHLVGNAVKFTPQGGTVRVAAYAADGTGGREVVVRVDDTGIGLDPARMDELWKPYSQVHDKRQVTALGAGLGLYVAKAIVEQHGGRVGASSPGLGQGSRFWFTLPADRADGTG